MPVVLVQSQVVAEDTLHGFYRDAVIDEAVGSAGLITSCLPIRKMPFTGRDCIFIRPWIPELQTYIEGAFANDE